MMFDERDMKEMLKRKKEKLNEINTTGKGIIMREYLEGQIDLLSLLLGEEGEF